MNVLKSDDALTTSGKLFQILGAWYRQKLSPKRVVLTFGTFKMSFPLKAYVVSLNEINSFKLFGFVLLFTSLKTEQRILLNLCSFRVLLNKSLRSSSYIVCLSLKTNRIALSFTSYFLQFYCRNARFVYSDWNVVQFSWAIFSHNLHNVYNNVWNVH